MHEVRFQPKASFAAAGTAHDQHIFISCRFGVLRYIHYEAPVEEQNFSTLVEFINSMEVREDDEEFKNSVDLMFDYAKGLYFMDFLKLMVFRTLMR